ncbi:MAG: CusA/CzcA family heavy metal efflux RND transporter [Bacteroidales bacterium]|nr:CusA/CzcA family heavy metal efflux RND transporter [Bacteroidales bacterium]
MHKFVEKIIALALRNHVFVLFLAGLLAIFGSIAFYNAQIEAYPDVTNTRVQVIAQWHGRSAEEVEKFVTLPVMQALNTIPRKSDVRSISLFGLSYVEVIFDDDVDDFFAQQNAYARMSSVDLPDGVEVEIEPPSGATGEIFRYRIVSDLYIREEAAINEWVVERELLSVPGVATITSFGGEEKIYEIKVNPTELISYGISPLQVFEAVENSNINVGGDVIKKGNQAYVVRGLGLLESVEDIENILIEVRGGTPIRIKQVADVSISSKPRLGQVGFNDEDDIVQGIVLMLRGENPSEVIKRLRVKIDELNERILPPNVKVVPFMDRTVLVERTIRTVLTNLLMGVLLVSVVVSIFLSNWRATLIMASIMPLSFLFAMLMLYIRGMPANLISLGSLDFGLVSSGSMVVAEIIFVAMALKTAELGGRRYVKMSKDGLIKNAASGVAGNIFFAQLILLVALLPIFMFQKVEGKMFSPFAWTLGYASLGALILSITYVPVMCKLFLNKPVRERHNVISSSLYNAIHSVYMFARGHKKATLTVFICLLLTCFIRFNYWGTEFIPQMNEGAIYVRATLPNSVHLDEAVRLTQEMKRKMQTIDEIEFILTQTGRPNDGTDATGFFNIEFHLELKHPREWNRRVSKDDLIHEIEDLLEAYPGIVFGFSQPIQDNVEEYVSGVKSSLVIKIFGRDLHQLEDYADQTAAIIQNVRGIEDVNVFRSIGLPEMQIHLDEARMARFGVSMADAQAVVEMAIGGAAAGTFYENERTFDIVIRYQKEFRDHEDKIANILIPTMDGENHVQLKDIADIKFVTGPAFVYREGSSRYVAIGFSIRGRDMGSTIREAQVLVETQGLASLQSDIKMVWAGEFESQQRATKRLKIIVPIAILLILFLLYMNFGTVKDTLIVTCALTFGFVGGFIMLWSTGTIFGISAGIGFIILFGITAIDGIILVSQMKRRYLKTKELQLSIDEAVRSRIRPMLMIALMSAMGLLPAALSSGMGSEIQKPFAIMIVGGTLIDTILCFTVLPQVFYFAYKRDKKQHRHVEA